MKFNSQKIAVAAMIAAAYAVLTILFSFSSYGLIQYRIAEALTILPAFSSTYVFSIFIGCLVSNLLSPYGWLDILVGSLASLIAAVLTYYIGKSNLKFKKYLAPIPPVIVNALMVGGLLYYEQASPTLGLAIAQVGWGELVCAYGLGVLLYTFIEKKAQLKGLFQHN